MFFEAAVFMNFKKKNLAEILSPMMWPGYQTHDCLGCLKLSHWDVWISQNKPFWPWVNCQSSEVGSCQGELW